MVADDRFCIVTPLKLPYRGRRPENRRRGHLPRRCDILRQFVRGSGAGLSGLHLR